MSRSGYNYDGYSAWDFIIYIYMKQWENITPEKRWEHVREWVDKNIAMDILK